MHPTMKLYRKVRDDLTLTTTEYHALMDHEDLLPKPQRRPALSKSPFMYRCRGTGVAPDGLAIGESGRLTFDKQVDTCRRDFMALLAERLIEGDFVLGVRFYSDDMVFARIRAAARPEEFFANPYGWMMDGLRDAASADHHYTYEKEY